MLYPSGAVKRVAGKVDAFDTDPLAARTAGVMPSY